MTALTMDRLEERLSELRRDFDASYAPGSVMHDVARLNGFRRKAEADGSFGRMFNGPQWLDGVAIRDGVIQGSKLAAQLVISNTFTTVDITATPTANRMELDASSLRFYGTVSAVANTKIVEVGPTGFELGSGSNKITYVASSGVLTVPAAVIGSLTIANVGTGILGGTYRTANSGARIEFSTSGILAYNSGGTNTINMAAASGDITITGTFTIQSATSGARTEIKNTGIQVFDSGGTVRAQLLNTGAGFVGSTSGLASSAALSWTSGGTSTINATSISTGSLNGGLLSGGTVADTAIASIAANKITAGTGIINNLTVASTLTLGSGGKIQDADGSYWDQTGIVLKSGNVFGDTIRWQSTGGTNVGSIYGTVGGMSVQSNYELILDGLATQLVLDGSTIDSNAVFRTYNKIYPGSTGFVQSTYYIDAGGSGIISNGIGIGGMLGVSSGNTINFISPGTGGSASNWSSFTVANIPDKSAGWLNMQIAGTNYRIPFYVNA